MSPIILQYRRKNNNNEHFTMHSMSACIGVMFTNYQSQILINVYRIIIWLEIQIDRINEK